MYCKSNEDEDTDADNVLHEMPGLQERGRVNSSSDKDIYPKSSDTNNAKHPTATNIRQLKTEVCMKTMLMMRI